jgi:peptide methionine sulfoxide reductase msrA/msrB
MIMFLIFALLVSGVAHAKENQYNKLTDEGKAVIIDKGTERPWSGKYVNFDGKGTYVCKQCNAPLYRSEDKFDSHCGWPSFDDEIPGAVKRVPDPDGFRTEIICANCGAHLGHVFLGEGLTPKNVRYCVNSISMNFIADESPQPVETGTAIFAGGCFWGVEYYFQQAKGVKKTTVGFTGGHTKNPTYKEVCEGNTGHIEAVKVVYDPSQTSYEELAKLFFQIHNPTQVDRQGPDIGEQYRSVIFYENETQKKTAEKLINILKQKGYKVATKLEPASTFYAAEDYHQDYYIKKDTLPYCHFFTKRF